MSNLANLLNPAPTSEGSPNDRTTNGTSKSHHSRNQSLTSPLEALAIAATTSTPVLSPTGQITSPFVPSASHQRSFSNSSSRPSSSHISLPMPHALSHPTPVFSPTFDSHAPAHHHLSARTFSEIADGTSRELPPLRRSITDEVDTSAAVAHKTESMAEAPDHLPTTSLEQLPPLNQTFDMDRMSDIRKHSARVLDDPLPLTSQEKRPAMPGKAEDTPTEAFYAPLSMAPLVDVKDELPATNDENLVSKVNVPMKREDSRQSMLLGGEDEMPEFGSTTVSEPAESKKRPAPKTEKKVEKKGIASALMKPAAKKRKLDPDSMDGTPVSRRSGTPASSRASKTPAPRNRKQSSATPMQSSPAPVSREAEANDEDEDLDDDSELFCICRKPDDHTWMIGCDGGCEDWFHGRCVQMNERDGNLIDKYICPNCREKGIGQTTWKPMCRLETCREPARVLGPKPSKYCCDEHGKQYMTMRALGKDANLRDNAKASGAAKKRRKENYTDNTANAVDGHLEDDAEDDQAYLRGGVLRAGELKALTSGIKGVEEFKKLGEGVLSPPRTASPDGKDPKMADGDPMSKEKLKVVYSSEEETQLAEIASKKSAVRHKREALGDREKFLSLVKGRAKSVLEELKKKDGTKDICGFDSRLSWSDEEFETWRMSNEGKKSLESGVLGAPALSPDENGDEKMTNGDSSYPEEIGKGVCQKKRCERHKQWFKLQLQDIAFEKDECRQAMRKLESDEKGVGERAMIRHLEGGAEADIGEPTANGDAIMKD